MPVSYTHLDVYKRQELIYESVKKGTELHEAIEETLKGKEMKLPEGQNFKDKDGTVRSEIRIKWWEDPAEMTYKQILSLIHI